MKRLPLGLVMAFSLIELLAVMAIIAILAASLLPAMSSLLDGSRLTQGGQLVVSQIGLARQIASARNETVQVRLVDNDPDSSGYGAIQLWSVAPTAAGTTPVPAAVSRLALLPDAVAIASDTGKLSPLLADAKRDSMPLSGGKTGDYVYFNVAPSGLIGKVTSSGQSTADESGADPKSADTMKKLYLTVVGKRFAGDATAPKNYVTVQLNPSTGAILVFRP